jgi:hypothetical protein
MRQIDASERIVCIEAEAGAGGRALERAPQAKRGHRAAVAAGVDDDFSLIHGGTVSRSRRAGEGPGATSGPFGEAEAAQEG